MASTPRTNAVPRRPRRRHHAVIAGTGRAGTTFLVEFLEACGLETEREQRGSYFERARAGLEHSLLSEERLPYVVKDPWLFSYFDDVDLETLAIDVLIVPMRDLGDAAASRVNQERMRLLETGWRHRSVTGVHGRTPGGVLYSLNPTDQARVLAVGFYELLDWAAHNEIPVILVDFPRIVDNGAYLVRALWPWLGDFVERRRAHRAYERVARPEVLRVGDGLVTEDDSDTELDRNAMVQLLDEQAERIAELEAQLAQWRSSPGNRG